MRAFLRHRVHRPLVGQLQQGATPEKLAWSLSLGAVLGTIPMLGVTTLLCGAAGFGLRLNHVALQVANYLVYPLQLLLLLPLLGAGGRLFSAPVPASLNALQASLQAGAWQTVRQFAAASGGAVVVWAILALPVAFVLRLTLAPLLRKLPLPGAPPAP